MNSTRLQKVSAIACLSAIFLVMPRSSNAQPKGFNYEESKVPPYILPNPLVMEDGHPVTDAKMWTRKRRPEILELFQKNVQGHSPARPKKLYFEMTSEDAMALGGKATRREITAYLAGEKSGPQIHILIYVPNAAAKPVPAFVGLNFNGNQTVSADPGITISDQWTWDNKSKSEKIVRPDESTRGNQETGVWSVEKILDRGYALATACRADIEPDYAEGWKHGIRGYYLQKSGKSEFAPDDWGAIGAWAWGASRILDYLEKDKQIDARHVAVMGHSRLGKAALWAGATDERFAAVISNDSGEGGAALSKRYFGETVERINTSFPHWFCANYKSYNGRTEALPVDAHELIALMAPRPVYVASAQEDLWADPRGEFLSAKNAEPVYRLFGKEGLGVSDQPSIHQPVGDFIAYHIRAGKHNVTEYDWDQYLNFVDRHFRGLAGR